MRGVRVAAWLGLFALVGAPRAPDARGAEPAPAAPSPAPALAPPLGRFTTNYPHDAEHRARAFNVGLAAEAIDGKAIEPGAVLSFNDVVGERTAAFGFEKAVVLRERMLAEGAGGGTCQVASTLHAAALLAGLDVVSRTPHSRPSGYIRMGLDATVAYPKIDLKVKNSRASRVTLRARAQRGTLDVWVDGEGERPSVTLVSEIEERTPFARAFEAPGAGERPVAAGAVRVKAYGLPGFRVRRTREVRGADGGVRRDVRIDEYPPTREVLLVPRGFDAARIAASALADDGDAPSALPSPTLVFEATDAVRPLLIQLRPSVRVTLDNAS